MSDLRARDLVIWQSFLLVLYVASGTLQPILIEVLTYNGACEKSTFLFILPTYVGMSMSILCNMEALKYGKIRWPKMGLLAVIELCSAALCFTGLICAGSAVFTVIYSSVTVYTALFSRLFFGRELHYMQWGGVFMVMLGLTSSSIGASFGGGEGEEDTGIGIIMIIIGSMFHSLVYILSESILKSEDPVAPEFLGSFMGFVGVFVFGLWQVFYTIPRFQDLILDEIDAHDGDTRVIIMTYIILVVINFIHGLCFYHLIKSVGSTTTGILKGVQSVMVFVISHFAFCEFQRSQCFTTSKGASLVVVVCGVSCYSIFKLDTPIVTINGVKGVKDLKKDGRDVNIHLIESAIQPPVENEYTRLYSSIDLSTRRDKDNIAVANSSGYGSRNSGQSSRNSAGTSYANSTEFLHDGSQAAQDDHSSLPRANPMYNSKRIEESRARVLKPRTGPTGPFDIGL